MSAKSTYVQNSRQGDIAKSSKIHSSTPQHSILKIENRQFRAVVIGPKPRKTMIPGGSITYSVVVFGFSLHQIGSFLSASAVILTASWYYSDASCQQIVSSTWHIVSSQYLASSRVQFRAFGESVPLAVSFSVGSSA